MFMYCFVLYMSVFLEFHLCYNLELINSSCSPLFAINLLIQHYGLLSSNNEKIYK